jgi:hypothetical protein
MRGSKIRSYSNMGKKEMSVSKVNPILNTKVTLKKISSSNSIYNDKSAVPSSLPSCRSNNSLREYQQYSTYKKKLVVSNPYAEDTFSEMQSIQGDFDFDEYDEFYQNDSHPL